MICFMDSKIIVWTFLHFATSSKIGVSPVSSEIILTASRVTLEHQQIFIEVTCTTIHVSTANFTIYYTSNGSTNLKYCIKETSCVIELHRLYDLKQAYECKAMTDFSNNSKTIIAGTLLPRTETEKSTSSDELLRENLKWIIAGVTIICVAATVSVAYVCGRMGKRYYDKIQRENRRQCTRKSSAYDVIELPEFPKTRPEKVQPVVTPREKNDTTEPYFVRRLQSIRRSVFSSASTASGYMNMMLPSDISTSRTRSKKEQHEETSYAIPDVPPRIPTPSPIPRRDKKPVAHQTLSPRTTRVKPPSISTLPSRLHTNSERMSTETTSCRFKPKLPRVDKVFRPALANERGDSQTQTVENTNPDGRSANSDNASNRESVCEIWHPTKPGFKSRSMRTQRDIENMDFDHDE